MSEPTETIFATAEKLITGDRRQAYGPVRESLSRTALIWSGILGITVTAQQVALCMVGLKIQRETNRPGRDNRVDMVGYVGLLDEVQPE